jgi:hypothetical protein
LLGKQNCGGLAGSSKNYRIGRALRAIVIGRNAKGSLQTHHEAIERPEHGHQKYGAREKKSFTRVISAEVAQAHAGK